MSKVTLWLTTGPSGSGIEITMEELAAMCNLSAVPDIVTLRIQSNDMRLEAAAATGEQEYPAIDIDGYDKNDQQMYLGGFELPNNDSPDTFTSRLYAGYQAMETDEPIALVITETRSNEQLEAEQKRFEETHKIPTKNVYVDTRNAKAQDWVSMEGLEEHA